MPSSSLEAVREAVHAGDPEQLWADPGRLPPDTVGYAAAVITAVEHGLTFTLNGW